MKFCFYRGVNKINGLYNDCVERTEIEIQEMEENAYSIRTKFGLKFGQLCEFLGLPNIGASIGADIERKSAKSKTVVTRLMPEQKQRIIEARALRDQGSLTFEHAIQKVALEGRSQYVSDRLTLKLDESVTPPDIVKRDKSAVLSGNYEGTKISIRVSLSCLGTEPTWMRFERHTKPVGVFGLMTY